MAVPLALAAGPVFGQALEPVAPPQGSVSSPLPALPPTESPSAGVAPPDDRPDAAGANAGHSTAAAGQLYRPGQLLALVGGKPIFVADVMAEANQLVEKHMADAPAPIKQRERDKLIERLLPKYVESKLMYVDAERSLPDTAKIEDIRKSLGEQFDENVLPDLVTESKVSSAVEYDAQLRAQGSSLRRARDNWIETQIVRYVVPTKVKLQPEITRQEMLDYYQQHQQEFARPARARWEQLTVKRDRFPSEAAARQAIAEMGNEVVYGAQLEAVARRRSQSLCAPNGGQHDWTARGSLAETELEQAIFTAPLGQLTDIIATPTSLHIVRVLERAEADVIPFAEAQTAIQQKLLAAKREAALRDYAMRLRREIPVEIPDPNLRVSWLKDLPDETTSRRMP